jgi:hypothetical protein
MHIDQKLLVSANLFFQCALLVIVIIAGYLARFKHQFKVHCFILRASVILQIISIAAVMLPAMLWYIHRGGRSELFNTAMLVHHILGLVVIALWVYVNLAVQGIIRPFGKLTTAMRLAFFLWIFVLLMGIYLYLVTWVL